MPELPEVETVRRGLVDVLGGAIIAAVYLGRPDLRFPFPDGFAQILQGARVTGLNRRAKYLLI
ncbi:MAG: DNA-formamidopyrimidine glycosylase family protein, partial [Alphaproteobacteria bacterium]